MGGPPAVYLGHSLGGNITQELVFRHPEYVKALILLGCTCNTLPLSRMDRLWLRLAKPMLSVYPWEILSRQSAQVSSCDYAVQSYLYGAFTSGAKSDFVNALLSGLECLHAEPGYRIEQPLLLAHGERDRTGNIRRIAPIWAAREPRCRYAVIPCAGHTANMDNVARFNELMMEFLTEVV